MSFSASPGFGGRLPESTASCSPKKGEPELLSMFMNDPLYLHPVWLKSMSPAMANKGRMLIRSRFMESLMWMRNDCYRPIRKPCNHAKVLTTFEDSTESQANGVPVERGLLPIIPKRLYVNPGFWGLLNACLVHSTVVFRGCGINP